MVLTEEQYKILCDLRDGTPIDEDENYKLLRHLTHLGYVRSTNYKQYNFALEKACDYIITENGKAACVEHEKSLRQEDREIKSLQIADKANRISKWSLVVSIISATIAVAAIIVAAV